MSFRKKRQKVCAKNDIFKVISVNARGLGDITKRNALFAYHRKNSDILILQETHSDPKLEGIWESQWGGKIIFNHGTTAARGIAVLMTKELRSKVSNIYKDSLGRIIIFDLNIQETIITIVALYAPNEDKPIFFEDLRKILTDRS